jgi:hypothetical protein
MGYTSGVEVKGKKTVRFDALVKQAGTPVQVTLWTEPEDDRDFMRAVKEKRVVTVIQHNVGTKKDYGLVGFFPQDRATYLLFPKRINHPDESKIVGIKYERLAALEPKGAVYKPPKPKLPGIPLRQKSERQAQTLPEHAGLKKEKPAPKPPEPPKRFKFQSRVELKAIQTETIEVEATSVNEAAKLLKAQADELAIDLGKAKVSKTVHKPRKKG